MKKAKNLFVNYFNRVVGMMLFFSFIFTGMGFVKKDNDKTKSSDIADEFSSSNVLLQEKVEVKLASIVPAVDVATEFNELEEEVDGVVFEEISNSLEKSSNNLEMVAKENAQNEEREIYEQYLTLYSSFYHLDSSKVIEIARRLTNDFTKDFSLVNGTALYDTSNKEAEVLTFVYLLNKEELNATSEEIGYTIDQLKLDYEIDPLINRESVYNGITISQFIGHVCDLLNVDKVLTYAISSGETGYQTSNLALNNNNFGGLTSDGITFYSYTTPESGVIAFVECLNQGYYSQGLTTPDSMAGKYCPGSSTWASFIYDMMWTINNNYDDYFLPVEDISLTLKK